MSKQDIEYKTLRYIEYTIMNDFANSNEFENPIIPMERYKLFGYQIDAIAKSVEKNPEKYHDFLWILKFAGDTLEFGDFTENDGYNIYGMIYTIEIDIIENIEIPKEMVFKYLQGDDISINEDSIVSNNDEGFVTTNNEFYEFYYTEDDDSIRKIVETIKEDFYQDSFKSYDSVYGWVMNNLK